MLGIPLKSAPLVQMRSTRKKSPARHPAVLELNSRPRAALATLCPEEILITSDTVVQLDGETLEKPESHRKKPVA